MNDICTKCKLYSEATKQCIPTGSIAPLIYFVGEAPGHEEDEAGIPFIGRSGQLLKKLLQKWVLKRQITGYSIL